MKFENFVGNRTAVEKLQSLIQQQKLPKQLMLTGNSGVGKTTLAKIVASNLNAYVKEFNIGNLTGIDNVREYIIEEYRKNPIGYDTKVYILDEIHKLSVAAQECLLTPLDNDTPTYFIACTTEPTKIKLTLRKRFTVIKLLPPTAIERRQCIDQLELNLPDDIKAYIVSITDDLRTVTKMSHLCENSTLEEAKVLCISQAEETTAIDVARQLMKVSLKEYKEIVEAYAETNDWRTLLTVLINYYTSVFFNKGQYVYMSYPIQPGCEKAHVLYLSSKIHKVLNGIK